MVSITFILTGGRVGQTVSLGPSWSRYHFIEGACTMEGSAEDMALHARFLEVNWQAYPEGHQALKENAHVESGIHQGGEPNQDKDLLGQGLEGQSGSDQEQHDGGGHDETNGTDGGSEDTKPGGQEEGLKGKILAAVKSLDPKNDSHWTAGNTPAVAAVAAIVGDQSVTRAMINEAAPGFVRS